MSDWSPITGKIDVTMDRDVAVLTLNRPEKLNALTTEMRRELAAAIRHFGDGSRARGLVLTGAGRAFSAGEDLDGAVSTESIDDALELFHDITRATLTTKVPTVAALNGLAVGGACEMTLAFDTRIGTSDAGYFMPENGIGLTISNASSYLLARLLRGGDAMRLVLDSRRLSAEEAQRIGMLDEIVDGSSAADAGVELVLRWTESSSIATAAHLELLRPPLEAVEAAIRRETEVGRRVWDSGTSVQGIERFLASRNSSDGPVAAGD